MYQLLIFHEMNPDQFMFTIHPLEAIDAQAVTYEAHHVFMREHKFQERATGFVLWYEGDAADMPAFMHIHAMFVDGNTTLHVEQQRVYKLLTIFHTLIRN